MSSEKKMATFAVAMSYSQNPVKIVQNHMHRTSACLKTETCASTLRIITMQTHCSQPFFVKYLDFFYL